VDLALTVGPWTLLESISKGAGVVTRGTLDWLAEHLANTGAATPHGAGAFTYDPADATPTVGGRLLSTAAGFRYDSGVGSQRDVVALRR